MSRSKKNLPDRTLQPKVPKVNFLFDFIFIDAPLTVPLIFLSHLTYNLSLEA